MNEESTNASSGYKIHNRNEVCEKASFQPLKSFFVLESLAFNNSNDLNSITAKPKEINNNLRNSKVLTHIQVENLGKCSPYLSSTLLEDNLDTVKNHEQNYMKTDRHCHVSSTAYRYKDARKTMSVDKHLSVAVSRPSFVLESLHFKDTGKVNSNDVELNSLENTSNATILNSENIVEDNHFNEKSSNTNSTEIPDRNSYIEASTSKPFKPIVCAKNTKYSKTNTPIHKPFFVLESLSYKKSGILRITPKNTCDGKSYEVHPTSLHPVPIHINKTVNEHFKSIAKSQENSEIKEKPSSNIKKEKYSNCIDETINTTYVSNLLKVKTHRQPLLNRRKIRKVIDRCLLLETDPVHFELLKTVRQPFVTLQKLSV